WHLRHARACADLRRHLRRGPATGRRLSRPRRPSARGGRAVIRILLADDHALMRDGLRGMLDAQPDMEVIGEANDGAAAVEATIRLHPDVVIMDIRMPRLDG